MPLVQGGYMQAAVYVFRIFVCLMGAMLVHDGMTLPVWAQVPDAVPEVCRDMPLPSSMPFDLDKYETRLGDFLRAECYRRRDWTHDVSVRDTGPWISELMPGTGNNKAY